MRSVVCGSFVLGLVLGTLATARADDQAVRSIIDKAIKAQGGEEKLAKGKAVTWKGKGTFHGLGMPIEFTGDWWVQPAKSQMKNVVDIEVQGAKLQIATVLSGDKGYRSMMGNVEELEGDSLTEAKEELFAGRVGSLLVLKDPSYKLSPLGESKVGDRVAQGVKVSHKDHRDVNLYFDKENGLLLKNERRVKDPMMNQEFSQETIYSDYRDVDGVQRAKKMTIKRDGNLYIELEITDYKTLEGLDDSVFAKPG